MYNNNIILTPTYKQQNFFFNYFFKKGKKATFMHKLRFGLLTNLPQNNLIIQTTVKTNFLKLLRFVPLFYTKKIKFRRKKKKDKVFYVLTEKKNLLYIQLYRLLFSYKKSKALKVSDLFIHYLFYSNLNQGQVLLNIKKLNNLGFYYIRFLRYNFYKKNYFFDVKRKKN